ncbi:MAG: response regulator receiver protein [Edaphobacter sp.]|nr:response regulator receiver protein [Edaphobacter sp.]
MTSKLKIEVVPLTQVPKEDVEVLQGEWQPVVLIVDDEKIIADTLSIILSQNGFSTMTAYDGISALKLARAVRPALLISDVVMPAMSGINLAISMTHMVPECKILLFSGQAATVDLLVDARNAGYDFNTLAKPVHPTDMLKRVSECLTMEDAVSGQTTRSSEKGDFLYQ